MALGLAPHLAASRPLVVSVAAGIPHASLARWFGPQVPVIRTMPNRPALNGFGATGLYAPASVGAAYRALAEDLMGAVSATVWVEHESQMDTVTAVSGSGPAYFFLFMEALEAAAHERGLPSEVAHRLTLETAFGAAQMARQSADSLATLREQVTSKGGTTAAALEVLNGAGLRAIVAHAVAAADRRSAELAAEFGGPWMILIISVGVASTPLKGGAKRLKLARSAKMEAIRYIVDMLLWLLLLAFVLRLLFQLVRADFRDPMADAIVRVTNWLILPLRKLLPPIGKIDTATVVAVLLVAGGAHVHHDGHGRRGRRRCARVPAHHPARSGGLGAAYLSIRDAVVLVDQFRQPKRLRSGSPPARSAVRTDSKTRAPHYSAHRTN